MDINELLDECKTKLEITSDYKLAKELEISTARVSEYRNRKTIPDIYACFKIAEILGKSPSVVLAQVQAVFNKNEAKRLYFKRFFTIAGLWIVLGQLSPNYNGLISNAYAHGKSAETRASATYQDIMRSDELLDSLDFLNYSQLGKSAAYLSIHSIAASSNVSIRFSSLLAACL